MSSEYQKSRNDNEISNEGYERRARNGCLTSAAFLASSNKLQIRKQATKVDSKLKKQHAKSIELCIVNGNKECITYMIKILEENKQSTKDIKRSERLNFMNELSNNKKPFCKSPLFTYEEMIFDKNEEDNKSEIEFKNKSQIDKNKKQTNKTSNEDYSYSDDSD